MTHVIYKIVCKINNKIYIGRTKNPIKKRWIQHVSSAQRSKNKNIKLYNAINLYGRDSFTIEELEKCINFASSIEKEIYFIKKYDSYRNGYNSSPGGEGNTARISWCKGLNKDNNEIIKKISERQTGKNNSFFGKTHTDELKNKWKAERGGKNHYMFGKKQPLLAKANSERIWTDEAKAKISKTHSKKIQCIETGEIFDSLKKASEALKINAKFISEAARGLSKQAKGLTFKYLNNQADLSKP